MERPRVTKYVRISVTALSLTACALLVVLWVRSYWFNDTVVANLLGRNFQANSIEGRLSFATLSRPMATLPKRWVFQSRSIATGESKQQIGKRTYPPLSSYGGRGSRPPNRIKTKPFSVTVTRTPTFVVRGIGMPHWAWLLPIAIAAIALWLPWIRWSKRFSLRTLLIVTTLVAVGLGVVIYLAR
jgi:hypothetical protein